MRSVLFTALDIMVTTLFCMPILPRLLKFTVISEDSPGAKGSLLQLVAVQPQVVLTSEITRASLPVFS
eukprot:m.20596 g.20596  ORF g.20596 m.20596 type:complete len:68 (-) comp6203_c0_seq1:114-317(-)